MQILLQPPESDWQSLIQRPASSFHDLEELVKQVFKSVQLNGDKAVNDYTLQFDKVVMDEIKVNEKEIRDSIKKIPAKLRSAIGLAKKNIEIFHSSQTDKMKIIETTKGVKCWRESRPIENVGLYIPSGSAPLFSTVLMLGIPAMIAGCNEIILCTPPGKNGEIHPAILYTASLIGISSIYKAGGIQAIAAMTFGTETIPKTDKIFGPGNQFVTAAKLHAQKFVAIDMPAGPSEVLIIVDKTSRPEFVAADLLSQAEHGIDSQVILLSTDRIIIEKILHEAEIQLNKLPRKEIAQQALVNSKAIILKSIEECIAFSNMYAPEHMILAMKKIKHLTNKIINAGSVFIGNYSCESAGDYASGTNHTLPTNGYARSYSGVSLDSFVKKITFQKVSKKGIQNIGPVIECMAEAEQLHAHKNAVTIRLKTLAND